MKRNLAKHAEIGAVIEALQQLPFTQKRRIVLLIDALGAVADSARPLSARLLSELSQLVCHDGDAHCDIIDLMIEYLQLQAAATQQGARLRIEANDFSGHSL